MPTNEQHTSAEDETFRPAWQDSKTNVSYGLPFPEACVKHIRSTFKASRVYIIASGSLSRNTDHVKRLQQALGDKVIGIRYGMQPHTLWSEVVEITKDAEEKKADLLITLGAGSLTDAAKIVALALANDATSLDDLDTLHTPSPTARKTIHPPTVPLICIPTSLSGGEYNSRGGGSNDHNHRKYSFQSNAPALVILDPELCLTTPDRWWLSTGVRAVDHCTEAICSLQGTAESDADAGKGLQLLVPGLLKCKKNPGDAEARFQCQLGVIEAMKAVNLHAVPMGGSHAIGHQLGPLGVGHGETSCILLPAVCKYNAPANAHKQIYVGLVLESEPEVAAVLSDAGLDLETADLGDMLDVIFRFLGMPRTLKEFEIGDEKLDLLAENSLSDRWSPTNPIPLTEKARMMEVLEMVKG